ncbi:diaminopimelate epimerase [Roseococcus sp. SYP-B2431]|uniref:diaminopimelate epimerase n=1 Tax=Roseococcus sp. SYP-B2431 TaxID=2496640 RepID=UPI0010390BD6|nr:diaminopimelate epimerase [Roseococcus sp. SYP-B2431]TCH99215.1 diaminopimelate epimerase [Roseococcus sp. SYP-B2431]
MRLPFRKMHGLGNDFVVLDARAAPIALDPDAIRLVGDRHRGVGFDQLVTLEPAADADLFIRFHNSDGSEAGACGNGTRCAASLVLAETGRTHVAIRTAAGMLAADRLPDGTVRVDMGPPKLGWRDVPLAREMDTLHVPLSAEGVSDAACCSMGNPHATFFVENLDALDIRRIGPGLEHDPLLPERGNIGFAQVLSRTQLRLVVWERGAGLTLACGSGACAAVVNARRRGLVEARCAVTVPGGGDLVIEQREDGHVLMSGPVATSFTGELELPSDRPALVAWGAMGAAA